MSAMAFSQNTTIGANDTSLNWQRSGAGQPVMLVHGITESSTTWDPVAERLSKHFDVIVVDLRGHGSSGTADDYGLAAMAGDLAAVISDCGIEPPHLVGHSLGGAVVSTAAAAFPVASVVNVDQSLQLGAFKEQLGAVEPMLRDAASFEAVMVALFDGLKGSLLTAEEDSRIAAARRPDQDVVLGVWDLIFSSTTEEIDSEIDQALAGFAAHPVPYLSLFGIDPGDGYAEWLGARIPGALVELWADHGHYPHLVEPDRFCDRISEFWSNY
ncbi:MAG: alpha/beta hydrolase [Acidimicrobiales bacterium]